MRTCVKTANFDGFELRYFRTTTQGEDEEVDLCYGVYVEKYVDGNLVEEMGSGPVSEDVSQISDVIDLLFEGSVTPFALNEILDEMEVLHQ